MRVRIDRNPRFWADVFEHPEVKPFAHPGCDLETMLEDARVTPFRTQHGGYLFLASDVIGRAYDLHAAYMPGGWGREAHGALLGALADMFVRGAQVLTAHEVATNWKSRPPRSFGFRPAGDFAPTAFGELRTWVLTKAMFEASPARSRLCLQP